MQGAGAHFWTTELHSAVSNALPVMPCVPKMPQSGTLCTATPAEGQFPLTALQCLNMQRRCSARCQSAEVFLQKLAEPLHRHKEKHTTQPQMLAQLYVR